MTHLTMEELLALREPGAEPGVAAQRAHLEGCPACRDEADRLDQRVARLRALPALRPGRDRWPVVRTALAAERRARRRRWAALAGLAAAASIALLLLARDLAHPVPADGSTALGDVIRRSRELEQAIDTWNPDARVTDGRTARISGALEDRIAEIDRRLEAAQLAEEGRREEALLRLWRERVGLLDALVDVHLTLANDVGL